MSSKEKLNHRSPEDRPPKHDSITFNESGQAISSVDTAMQNFNGDTLSIMNIADKNGIGIEEADLQKLNELSGEAVSAQKEFFNEILSVKGLEQYKSIIEKGENQRASTITDSIFDKSKKIINNKSFQKFINHTPYVGDIIMVTKMLRGKEGDHKLTPREYLFYSASVLSAAISFYYLTKGDEISTGVSLSISEGISYVDSTIGIIKDVSGKLMASDSKLSGILSVVSNSFNKSKYMLGDISINVINTLKQCFAPNYSFSYATHE